LANPIVNASMFITKSSISNGVMKWSAVNSDIEPDLYGERMSLDLYHKMLSYIKSNTPPPDNFKDFITLMGTVEQFQESLKFSMWMEKN
jgi:hypothetical protein